MHLNSYSQTDVGSNAVLIQTGGGSGSGFYLSDTSKSSIYLITACHVLINPQNGTLYSDSILLISYKKNSQVDDKDSFRVSLLSAYKMGMLSYNIIKDVVVVKIATEKDRGIMYFPFVEKLTKTNTYLNPVEIHATKKISELETMNEVYTIGYPKSLSLSLNLDFNRPLIRKGIIAGLDLSKGKIIADCPTYQGNSGGMVFEVLMNGLGQAYVIGIVSQFVPFEEHWKNEAYNYYNTNVYNSGYTVVVPMDAIIEQLNLLR